ncbi:MAG: VanZ family protein [Thermoanaerobaculia bacterium]
MTGGAQKPAAGARTDRGNAWGRWFPLAGATLAILVLAPFLGVLQEHVRESVGLGYLRWVSGGLAAAGAAALVSAVVRIRRFRLRRYGLLLAAGLLVALQVGAWGVGEEETDVLERVHLLEYGVLAVLFVRAFRPGHGGPFLPVLALLGVALVGLADETVQWLTPVRVGDFRDVVLNAYAGLVGVLFVLALRGPRPLPADGETGTTGGGALRRGFRPRGPQSQTAARGTAAGRSLRLSAGLGAVVVLAGAAFFDAAHLGHEIRDPEAGVFLSWHSPEELRRAADERAERWSRESIPPHRPLAREDYFLSEAGWHANERNHAVRVGDLRRAWRENRILERWYQPYLEVRGGWPERQRAKIERELEARDPAALEASPGYRSPALEGRVVAAPPRPFLWGGAVLAAGALLAVARGRGSAGPGRPGMFAKEELS